MLTGDKQQTAINIGRACNVIKDSMKVIIIDATRYKDVKGQVTRALALDSIATPLALVVDGKALQHCLLLRKVDVSFASLAVCGFLDCSNLRVECVPRACVAMQVCHLLSRVAHAKGAGRSACKAKSI